MLLWRNQTLEETEGVDLLGLLLDLLYCPEEVKNVLGNILEMLPKKLNIAEIIQEDYCLETLCSCLPQRVRWWTFSFQRSVGLLNSWTLFWRQITYFRAFCGSFGNERIVILYVYSFIFLFFSKGGADVFCSHEVPHYTQYTLFCDVVPDTWTKPAYATTHSFVHW